jgi:hypothetical protein
MKGSAMHRPFRLSAVHVRDSSDAEAVQQVAAGLSGSRVLDESKAVRSHFQSEQRGGCLRYRKLQLHAVRRRRGAQVELERVGAAFEVARHEILRLQPLLEPLDVTLLELVELVAQTGAHHLAALIRLIPAAIVFIKRMRALITTTTGATWRFL